MPDVTIREVYMLEGWGKCEERLAAVMAERDEFEDQCDTLRSALREEQQLLQGVIKERNELREALQGMINFGRFLAALAPAPDCPRCHEFSRQWGKHNDAMVMLALDNPGDHEQSWGDDAYFDAISEWGSE